MKKTLVFLLILSLALSGTLSANNTTLVLMTKKLQTLKLNITHIPHVSKNTSKHYWECKDFRVFLNELAEVLKKVKTENLASELLNTLESAKEYLQEFENWYLHRKPIKVENKRNQWKVKAQCSSRSEHKHPLESYVKVLQCFNRACNVTLEQS